MGMTTIISKLSVVHKDSGGAVTSFPDVCKTPSPPSPVVPLPYPMTSGTSAKTSTGSVATKLAPTKSGPLAVGAAAKTVAGVISSKTGGCFLAMSSPTVIVEMGCSSMTGAPTTSNVVLTGVSTLRGRLTALHGKLVGLSGSNPELWRQALDEYVQTAAQLYVLLNATA